MKNIAILGQKWPKIIYFSDKYWGAESSKDTLHMFCFWPCPLVGCEEKTCTIIFFRKVKSEKQYILVKNRPKNYLT